MATINKALNVVVDVQRDDGSKVFVHSTPISRAVFKEHYLVMAKTFDAIYTEGLGRTSGPRIAALMLRSFARNMNILDGPTGVEMSLIGEIKRLTIVIAPTGAGWEQLPFDEAVKRGILDEDDVDEVENCIVFFTVAYSIHRKQEKGPIIRSACNLWSAQITSSNSTEFTASLQTLTPAATTGAPTSVQAATATTAASLAPS